MRKRKKGELHEHGRGLRIAIGATWPDAYDLFLMRTILLEMAGDNYKGADPADYFPIILSCSAKRIYELR